jgi:predicted nucleotidyltransferase
MDRLRRFLSKAAERINIVEAYLVGSRARGDYTEESDVDVVIVALGVEGLNQKQRVELLADVAEPGIEYRVYTLDEWYGEKSLWIKAMRREAVKIYP